MSSPTFADVLRAAIDPVAVPFGFASGQGTHDQTIFCADGDALFAAHPGLPWDELGGGPGTCTDLVVDGSIRTGVYEARLDGLPLQVLLRAQGRDDEASALDAVIGAPTHVGAPVVAASLAILLRVTARAS
jgi:hypothetical protein